MSILIAKCGKNHSIGEFIIKPSITAFIKIVLKKDDNSVKAEPLSYNTVSKRIADIPIENITSCAADGAPAMMGKKGCLKISKDKNREMLLVNCVIHREN